jgi:hypothetical protein
LHEVDVKSEEAITPKIITFSPASGARGASINFTATISAGATPPVPHHTGAPIASFTVGDIIISNGSYTYDGASATITGTLVIPSLATTGNQTATITFSPPTEVSRGPVYTQTGAFTITP